jgi:hypothetical protein
MQLTLEGSKAPHRIFLFKQGLERVEETVHAHIREILSVVGTPNENSN